MKVMPLGVKCVAYASGNGDGSLQVTGTALAEAQNFNEGVIEVWILFSGCEGAPAFGTAAIIVRDLTSFPAHGLTAICCMMPCACATLMPAQVTACLCASALEICIVNSA